MARAPVLAAGGIVLRQARPPLIAVVRLRKGEWVLPKGKLDDGETPRDAAEREVLEETGHDVSVHEFLGTLAYDAGGRSKIVHYWRMETQGRPTRDLMRDVIAVDWLPLEAAVERLSRDHERAFLANVGPLALESAALARRSRETSPREAKPPVPVKRPRRRNVAKPPAISPPVVPLAEDVAAVAERTLVEPGVAIIEPGVAAQAASLPDDEAINAFALLLTREVEMSPAEAERSDGDSPKATDADAIVAQDDVVTVEAPQDSRVNVMARVRGWLRRVG
jgi:8-oxo-dGTP diphosphatase